MSKVNRTQTRQPGASLAMKGLDPDKKYCRVQISEPGVYKSPLPRYLDAESPTRPGEMAFKIVADGQAKGDDAYKQRMLAGGEDMVLLECSKEDHAHIQRYGHPALSADGNASGWQDAVDRGRAVEADTGDKFEQIQGGGVLTA